MRQAFHFGAVGAIALAVATACGAAHASDAWAATHTMKHDVGNAVAGSAFAPGESVHIAVSLHIQNQADMDALTSALTSGKTTRHLTSPEFMAHYAPSQAQVDAVVAHLRNAGFTNIEVAPNRLLVSADGTAAAVQAGFNTGLRHYVVDGRDRYANTEDAQVPAHLAGLVTAVLGLQNVHSAHTMNRPLYAGTVAAAQPFAKVGHAATDFSTIYDADSVKSATHGVIGIIAQGDVSPAIADLHTLASEAGFPSPVTKVVIADHASSDTSNEIEWDIDSQSSLASAGGQVKNVTFYVASTLDDAPLVAAYNAAVTDNTARAINVSLGECELNAQQSGHEAAVDAIYQIAVAQGQMFSVSSGDSGSFQCGSKFGGGSYPAVSPWAIAVGGTSLNTTGQTVWASETLWGCNGALGCEFNGGEGGGPSKTEDAPQWQLDAGVLPPGSTARGEPDVSFDADPATGLIVISGSSRPQYGGTSLAAPIWAGFWTRIQSLHKNQLNFPGPGLYQASITPKGMKYLHDITQGSNGGYSTATGWDQASGFGSIDIAKFATYIRKNGGF
jgi:pseudomonalisin/xanthomonalisin